MRRNAEARRRQDLAAAHAHLTYIKEWFSTQEILDSRADLGPMRTWAAAVLNRQMWSLHNNIATERASQSPTSLWALIRSVLLLYPLRSALGSLVRLAFYLLLILTCSMLPALFFNNEDGWGWGDRIGSTVLFAALMIGLLYGLRWLAIRLSSRLSPPAANQRSPDYRSDDPRHD